MHNIHNSLSQCITLPLFQSLLQSFLEATLSTFLKTALNALRKSFLNDGFIEGGVSDNVVHVFVGPF